MWMNDRLGGMKETIYIRLLGEGTEVFRPITASKIGNSMYEVGGYDVYDPEDEIWEFPPGTQVIVEEQVREGEKVLIAMRIR